MSTYFTWLQIWQDFQSSEVDLELEDFVDKDEARQWANEAIDELEAEFLTIYEDYFLTLADLDFALGSDEVALPDNIYAMKIRAVWFKGGATTPLTAVTSVANAGAGLLGVATVTGLSVGSKVLLKEGNAQSQAYYVVSVGALDVELSETFDGELADLGGYSTDASIYAYPTSSGNDYYELKRIRDWKKFAAYRQAREADSSSQDYRYFIVNRIAGGPVMKVTPVIRETGIGAAEIWYIRNANRLLLDDDICDLPEAVRFISDHMKFRLYDKEQHPSVQVALATREQTKKRIIETLTAMVPDNANDIEPDTSHYEESN